MLTCTHVCVCVLGVCPYMYTCNKALLRRSKEPQVQMPLTATEDHKIPQHKIHVVRNYYYPYFTNE